MLRRGTKSAVRLLPILLKVKFYLCVSNYTTTYTFDLTVGNERIKLQSTSLEHAHERIGGSSIHEPHSDRFS